MKKVHTNKSEIVRKLSTKNGFVQIDNELIQSNTLTIGEKGLLVYILSLPPDWVLYKSSIYKALSGDTVGSLDRSWKGLQMKKYIVSNRIVDKDTHQFSGWRHIVSNIPQE